MIRNIILVLFLFFLSSLSLAEDNFPFTPLEKTINESSNPNKVDTAGGLVSPATPPLNTTTKKFSNEIVKNPLSGFIAEITRDRVNVRAGANINYEVLCKLNLKDRVNVLEKRFNWYKIVLPKEKTSCFINQRFLKSDDAQTGIVLANRVNLRARPNSTSTIMAQVNKGEVLNIISRKDEWFQVQPTDNCFGWVNQEFLKTVLDVDAGKEIQAIPEKPLTKGNPEIPTDNKVPIEINGKIKASGKIFGLPVTHKLITQDKKIYYLKADKNLLNSFLYRPVKVQGKIFYNHKTPIITVERVEFVP